MTWNLGNGEGHSVLEVIRTVERVAGRKVPHRLGARRPGDPAVLVAGSARAMDAGWQPRFARAGGDRADRAGVAGGASGGVHLSRDSGRGRDAIAARVRAIGAARSTGYCAVPITLTLVRFAPSTSPAKRERCTCRT